MLHVPVRVNRKLCYTCGAIDSSKNKSPWILGRSAYVIRKKKLCGCFALFMGISMGNLDFIGINLEWKIYEAKEKHSLFTMSGISRNNPNNSCAARLTSP